MNGSSILVRFIELSVGLSSLTVVLMFFAVVIIRSSNGVARKHRGELTSRWRSVFVTPYTGVPRPDPLPPVGKRDWFTVLQLFEQFHDIREHDRVRAPVVFPLLDAMAKEIGLDAYALDLLRKKAMTEKITALNVLGHMHDRRAFETASLLCSNDGPEVSRAAAHAALRIDPEFIDRLLELVRDRDDWARPRIEVMLREADPQRLDNAMRRALDVDDDAGRTRLLDYVRFCTPAAARDICRNILKNSTDVETIAAALRSLAPLAGENDRNIALAYCRSPESAVALGALRVLRKSVQTDDDALLRELTAHRDYWLRLRAAEVVVQLYGNTGLAEELGEHHPDLYARDAIRQALAERKRMDARRAEKDRRGLAVAAAHA